MYTQAAKGIAGDCEAADGGWWQQDVNAWSSFVYVAVAGVLVGAVLRRRLPPAVLLFALVVGAEGLGSVLYHGAPSTGAWLLHDVAMLGMLGFLAGWHVGRLTGRADRLAVVGTTVATLVGATAWQASESVTSPLAGTLVLVIAGAEWTARRRGRSPVWGPGLLTLATLSVLMWVIGRSDSSLCEPGSWLQPHALWHLASAFLVLAWADGAYGQLLERPPRLLRRATDRALGLVAMVLSHAFHRSLDVAGRDRLPTDRPVLIVANHANGFVDPILVAALLGRLPRFLAKAALWKVVPARPFLALAGVLPVHRSSDGDRPGDNLQTFSATHRELAQRATVAIFPEGTTGDRGGLDRVRTGAARIAIGALHAAPDLVVVPIGMAFESRIQTRSRASIVIGQPIPVAEVVRAELPEPGEEPDRGDVRALTAAITAALQAVAPDFESRDERDLLRAAARTVSTIERPRGEPSFGEVDQRARRLSLASSDQRAEIMDAYRRYATHLHLMGLSDRQLRRRPPRGARLVVSVLTLVVFAPFILTVTLVHLPAVAIVMAATGAVRSTATKGTVRLLVGLVLGLATWLTVGTLVADGPLVLVAAAAVGLGGWIVLSVWTSIAQTVQAVVGALRRRDRAGLLAAATSDRDTLIAVVHAAEATP